MYVYFIQESEKGPVKIGVARDVEKRLSTMQTGNSKKLNIRAKLQCGFKEDALRMEKDLHKKFKNYWIRGEWFSGKILNHMNKVK